MPLYDFKDEATGQVSEYWVKLADLDQFRIDNPNLTQVFTQLNIVDPIRASVTKRHSGLTEKLKGLKQAHLGSTIDV